MWRLGGHSKCCLGICLLLINLLGGNSTNLIEEELRPGRLLPSSPRLENRKGRKRLDWRMLSWDYVNPKSGK